MRKIVAFVVAAMFAVASASVVAGGKQGSSSGKSGSSQTPGKSGSNPGKSGGGR